MGACSPVLPTGAKAAVLYGDPAKEGQFALRLKLPRGYHVPPHTHPVDENVTVISGRFQLGMGEAADKSKAKALPAGSFFSLAPGMVHYVYTDEETVIQINTVGPWGLIRQPEGRSAQKKCDGLCLLLIGGAAEPPF